MQYISNIKRVEKPTKTEAATANPIDTKKLQARLLILQHAKNEQMQYLNQVKARKVEMSMNNSLVQAFMENYKNMKQAA
jgi:hypothetical protein